MRTWTAVLLAVGLVGCDGGGDMPETAPVTGRVTLDGQPVPDANVQFSPDTGGRSSTAVTDADGRYVLQYNGTTPGAKVGPHTVRLTTLVEPTLDDNGKVAEPGRKEVFSSEFNTESTLQKEVKAGDNVIDLEL